MVVHFGTAANVACPGASCGGKPINFEDDGPEALAALKEHIAAEKAAREEAKKAALRRGFPTPGDDDDEEG